MPEFMNPIIQKCQELYNEGLSVDSVCARFKSLGVWEISISMNSSKNDRKRCSDAFSDLKNMPKGISVFIWERMPDERFEIRASEEGLASLIHELAVVGCAEDWCKFGESYSPDTPLTANKILAQQYGYPSYCTKPNKWFRR